MKLLTILSLGAGVQSTTLALMATHGLIEKPDYAIFSDTGWESQQTLTHLDELEKQLSFPVIRTSNGNLLTDLLSGLSQIEPFFTPPPFFIGNGALGKRHCTTDYKIVAIKRKLRELLGVGERVRLYDDFVVMQIGISLDECHRWKPSDVKYIHNDYPLLDKRMTRLDCENWLKKHGYRVPPKSSCVGCPYHSDSTWQQLKSDCRSEFDIAVNIDALLRDRREAMHKSMRPLDTITFKSIKQVDMFGNECTGLCGV